MRLFRASPARDPTPLLNSDNDDVYPVHMLDDTKTLRNIVVTWTLRFNDVLDADKLHASLSKLLDIGDWRKVGGRLRLKDGKLEIHVPRPFTAERPAVSYTHQALDMNIESHSLAKTLPRATDGPSIQPGLRDFICQYRDTPQLSLHVTSFDDATLVALSWPHTLMDVMGQQALLRGWSLVLAGRDSEVPPLLGVREDAICAAADYPVKKEDQEEFEVGRKRLRGWAMFMFGLRFAWDLLWNQVVETRTIYLPKKVVAELQRQTQGELPATDGERPFISEGDVLTAWAVRAVASSLPQPRPVTVVHALNARFRLSSLVQTSGVYVQNMAVAAFTFLTPDIATSLGPVALENRRHLMEQSTEAQVLAFLRELRSTSGSDPALVLCGEPDAVLMPFTNWTRADFFKTADFSPALVRAGETGPSRSNPPGTMVFHHAQSMRQGPTVRNVVVVLGKDYGDNYWLTGILLPQAWAKIEEDISRCNERYAPTTV
ncbi:uncharacterized protein BDZ99DRAFT_506437 [Mytilinidion resinicola]|uniref:Uncharacterized protein n=1 Tax=Mytilinidion resinicola TaxID=574789 RepID=A0A6A6Z3D8_9PEZI|nr:uncharacterized protein BDZ99DRAFT_506437 [Mytilinidion resinicola]KAF2815249.1 hypothetical protein BDZ99DRAFT_506437 [Mytilinidion resinicola]